MPPKQTPLALPNNWRATQGPRGVESASSARSSLHASETNTKHDTRPTMIARGSPPRGAPGRLIRVWPITPTIDSGSIDRTHTRRGSLLVSKPCRRLVFMLRSWLAAAVPTRVVPILTCVDFCSVPQRFLHPPPLPYPTPFPSPTTHILHPSPSLRTRRRMFRRNPITVLTRNS